MSSKIVLIVGPSGSGKTAVTEYMEKLYGLKSIVSYTTRPPRYEGEKGHIFLTEQVFKSMPDLCAPTFYNGYYYGTTADVVNRSDLYVLEPEGVEYFKKDYKGHKTPVVVYIDVPEDIRRSRMIERGDNDNLIEERLSKDKKLFEGFINKADIIVSNDEGRDLGQLACEILRKSGLEPEISEKERLQQNLSQTELRILSVTKNIEKTNRTLEKHQNLLLKRRDACLRLGFDPDNTSIKDFRNNSSLDSYWAYCDFKHTKDDIESTVKKIDELKEKLAFYREKQKEIDRVNDVPNVPAVEDFLANWRKNAEVWLRNQVIEMVQFVDKISETRREIRKKYIPNEYKYRKEILNEEKELQVDTLTAKTRIVNTFSSDVRMLFNYRGVGFEAHLENLLNDEVKRKRSDLFHRCAAQVGVITDATGLYVADNLSLNGVVIGEHGKAQINTVGAGGHSVQCFHYRVLVQPIKDKDSLDQKILSSGKLAALQNKESISLAESCR